MTTSGHKYWSGMNLCVKNNKVNTMSVEYCFKKWTVARFNRGIKAFVSFVVQENETKWVPFIEGEITGPELLPTGSQLHLPENSLAGFWGLIFPQQSLMVILCCIMHQLSYSCKIKEPFWNVLCKTWVIPNLLANYSSTVGV